MADRRPAFELVAGVQVPDLAGIHEGFSVRHTDRGYQQITVNVSARRLVETVLALARQVRSPGFLVLEVPSPPGPELGEDPGARWMDVHYLDGIDHARFVEIVETHRDLLVDDGEVNFGFGSNAGYDEVFVGAYKVVSCFAEEPRKYLDALVTLGYGMEDQIRTVWDTFNDERPGRRLGIEVDGQTSRDLVDLLGEEGLFFSERRRDPPLSESRHGP